MYGSLIRKALAQHPSSLSDKYEEGFASADNEHAVDLVLDAYPSKTDLSNLKIEKVCVDAFIFMVNKDNPVESLTLKQIKDIYTGKVTNWAELGGKNIPIKAYQRDATSSSQPVMAEQIMKGEPMIPQIQTSISWGMGQFRGVCAEYDNGVGSIGYAYIYQFNKLYKDENVKILKIDGIAPSQEALASGSYPLSPFSVSYYGAARESDGPDSVGHKFLEWILSAEGQKCVEQAGYVPAR
ncbi:MAG: substrate-binding domain-containing protein [Clostridiales bacterium]|nr:substrate-binding domain-containing protein [Clostridiales bacterium]